MSSAIDGNGAPRKSSPAEAPDPEKPICNVCSRNQVRFIGLATWDVDLQFYDFDPVLLDVFCLHCLKFTEVKWIPHAPDPA